jgi:exonuclease III
VIIIQVNVLNHDIGASKRSYPKPGCEKVLGNNQKLIDKNDTENDVILQSLASGLKCKRLKRLNVIKQVKRILETFSIPLTNLLRLPNTNKLSTNRNSNRKISTFQLALSFKNRINSLTFAPQLENVIKEAISLISNNIKITISSARMLSLTIYITLLRQNVESNPGMKVNKGDSLAVLRYNCNGLGDKKKLKRLTLKLGPIVNRGGIIFLQETHLIDTSYLSTIWKNKLESNCIKSNAAGVIILYNNALELIECSKDNEGRLLTIVVQNQDSRFILANSYFPNDHKVGITFAERVYLKILEMQYKYPDFLTIAAGDYNVCMKINDSINRLTSNSEKQLRTELSNRLAFQSKAKWFEYGEKSNKFFLNLLRSKQNQKLISSIRNGDKVYNGTVVIGGIRDFYMDLYAAAPRQNLSRDNFYRNCPKLTNEQAISVDTTLTAFELYNALKSCKNSSPGLDGIPYLVYIKLWKIAGPIILDSWRYSIEKNVLPPSHYESVITLLPKEGKDTRDIKNWRPITLSNCDAKIITKALSNKVSKVLDSIIYPLQTAYVPGRSVADILRTNLFLKNYCEKRNIASVLISLDAKKAFDSVNHQYIEETLRIYGFGEGFIGVFKLLYSNITARILVNGFLSESINIERGVKQGDALSCAIFIICIDPLLRNIKSSKSIKGIDINYGKDKIIFNGGAFADDISVICINDNSSIQGIFDEYNKLTQRSGLELNAEKTEI